MPIGANPARDVRCVVLVETPVCPPDHGSLSRDKLLCRQGGVRQRVFFVSEPERAPTLNKTPLVRWNRRYAYVSSTHQILPTRLHDVFDFEGGGKVSGALLHTKFLPIIGEKSREELSRGQHFENSSLYQDYHRRLSENPDLWHEGSCRYKGPEQLVELGLMSRGHWVCYGQ